MTSTVSCILMGGLGNQLFQIFTTITYGIRYKRNIVFPYSETLNYGILRNTYWDSFLAPLKNMTTFHKEQLYTNEHLSHFVQYHESCHHYQEIPKLPNKEFALFGYFQSPKYFESEKQQIFSMINLSDSLKQVKDEYSHYFLPNNCTISMHFRLGDYKNNPNCHPILPYNYYDNALMQILLYANTNLSMDVLYFCEEGDNDIVAFIVKELSEKYEGFHFIKVDDRIDDWKQILLMGNCQHNIIANSSFSWWGAYFNESPDKIVCYPSLWFGPALSNKKMDDMFPSERDGWTKILA